MSFIRKRKRIDTLEGLYYKFFSKAVNRRLFSYLHCLFHGNSKKIRYPTPTASLTPKEEKWMRIFELDPKTFRRKSSSAIEKMKYIELKNIPSSKGFQISSLETLLPGAWLNDEILNTYLMILSSKFENLMESGKYNYDNVRRWTKRKKVDIFSRHILFVPINNSGVHWSLIIFYMKTRKIIFYDSLRENFPTDEKNAKSFEKMKIHLLECFFRYLADEWKDKKKTRLDTGHLENFYYLEGESFSSQQNDSDCGVFVSMAVHAILSSELPNFPSSLASKYRDLMFDEVFNYVLPS
eukprot:snap_masked-scaffold_30-processed-gene-2.52-mRNA-1 protein AED:1.00 eAED:1.00 QI:0/0/0/0/1/1/2/0/294